MRDTITSICNAFNRFVIHKHILNLPVVCKTVRRTDRSVLSGICHAVYTVRTSLYHTDDGPDGIHEILWYEVSLQDQENQIPVCADSFSDRNCPPVQKEQV